MQIFHKSHWLPKGLVFGGKGGGCAMHVTSYYLWWHYNYYDTITYDDKSMTTPVLIAHWINKGGAELLAVRIIQEVYTRLKWLAGD